MIKPLTIVLVLVATLLVACGDDGDDTPLGDRLTAQAANASPTATPPAPAPTTAPTVAPTPVPSPDAATVLQVRTLSKFALTVGDVPAGYEGKTQQGAFEYDVVVAQVAIPKLAKYFQDSDLRGSFAALYTNPGPPETGISSILYLFTSPEAAQGLVDVSASIEAADYLSATEAQLLPAPQVGEKATLTRFRTVNGRSLELTWSQGVLAGQIIFRSTEDTEADDAIEEITRLAGIQAERMAAFLPR